jgi:hypothetical protein
MKDEYDFSGGVRGPVFPMPPGYTRIRFVIADEVHDWFRDKVDRAGGGDYQRLMNDALREHVRQQETIEEMLRRMVREELGRASPAGGARRRARRIGALRRLGSERRV